MTATRKILYLFVTVCGAAACDDVVSAFPPGVFATVAGGFQHTCGLLGNSTLYCWGRNGQFQLGYGPGNDRDSLPRPVSSPLSFTQLDASEGHSCAVSFGSRIYCWGVGDNGELGNETLDQAPTPIEVEGGLFFTRVTLGRFHSCGMSGNGRAFCWGLNDMGALGRGSFVGTRTPVAVAGNITFRDLAAGDTHTCGVTSVGIAACWGSNAFGQVGTGDTASQGRYNSPTVVSGGQTFAFIAAGNTHTCALTPTGIAYCWGSNLFGMLGDGTRQTRRVPVQVAGDLRFSAISIGAHHSCALNGFGEMYCWGNNNTFGGTPTASCDVGAPAPIPCSLSPIRVAPGILFRSIGVGAFHTCGVMVGGGAFCWGLNDEGQVGNGEAGTTVATPTRVTDP